MSDPYLDREQMRYQNPIASREFILNILNESVKTLRLNQLIKKTKTSKSQWGALKKRLAAMVRDGQIQQQEHGGYVGLKKKITKSIGTIQRLKDGNVEVVQQDETLIPVIGTDASILLGGDKVEYHKVQHLNKEHAVIDKILDRPQKYILGMIDKTSGSHNFMPLQRGLPRMRIVETRCSDDLDNQVIRAEIVSITARMWNVALHDVLGHVMDQHIPEMIAKHNGLLHNTISKEVQEQIDALSYHTDIAHFPDREDWTHLPFVTIDGMYSRDFDDAVMARRRDNVLELYIAIADVSYYVPVGSPLDTYAFEHTTSVYFPKHCVPMLPEVLSNQLCSLLPHVPRLALGVRICINDTGDILSGDIHRVVIVSHARMTYVEVDEMIHDKRTIPAWFNGSLDALVAATKALQYAAMQRRALNIRSRQDSIDFDDQGLWSTMLSKETLFSHTLIEKMMVCANNFIAIYLKERGIETIFRHHPQVRSAGHESLIREMKNLGIDIADATTDLYGLNEFLRTHDSYQWLAPWVVRAMSQARYETQNSQHWGLALEAYVHFTSPIRRYPDLMVHRALVATMGDTTSAAIAPVDLDVASRKCSRLERRADAIVYDAIDWYQCQWVNNHIGEVYEGYMVTLLGFGVFVRLVESSIEVLLAAQHLESLGYTYDTLNARWVHPRLQPLVLGQKINVIITQVSFPLRRRDAHWVNPPRDVIVR